MITQELFSQRITRLKALLGVGCDKDTCIYLGISKSALTTRKARGAFPEKELRLLALRMKFDVDYVLHGGHPLEHHMPAMGEAALLQQFRAMSGTDRNRLIDIAKILGETS